MNVILASTQSRLAETAAEDDKWWFALSDEQKKAYVKKHPKSKYAHGYNYKGDLNTNSPHKHPDFIYHPNVDKKNGFGTTPLHDLARFHPGALHHPSVSKVRDREGLTPLHYAAWGSPEALKHPDAAKVKGHLGDTPLHLAAESGFKEAKEHPSFNKVKNNYGETPAKVFRKD